MGDFKPFTVAENGSRVTVYAERGDDWSSH